MKRQFRNVTLAAVTALACMLATPARATLSVMVDPTNLVGTVSGGTLFTDGGAGDTCIAAGTLCFSLGALNFSINGSTSTSTSPIAALTFTANGVPSATGSPLLTFAISDTGFTTPPVPLTIAQDASGLTAPTDGAQGTVSAQGYFSSTNTLFSTSGATTGSTGTVGLGAGSLIAHSGPITSGSPYALTSIVFLNVTALATGTNKGVQVNADLDASGVPEPTSITLLGGVLLFSAGAIRRRMTRRA